MNARAAADQPIKVLVVDDHPLLRRGLVASLSSEADMTVVAEAIDGRAAVECFVRYRPDVTVMDLQMPVMDGIEATAAIRAESPNARIVVLTTYKGDAKALRALKAGASGYLLKSMIRTDLLDGIRAVHAGGRYIPREVANELAAHVTDELLSAREIEVLKKVADGNTNLRISQKLYISEDTVKTHLKNIMSKLGANDRTHAVAIALKRGIIEF